MKSILQKRSFVSNRVETLNFRDFINAPKVERIKKPAIDEQFRSFHPHLLNEKSRSAATIPNLNNRHNFVPISKDKSRSVTTQSAIALNPTNQRNFAPVAKGNSANEKSRSQINGKSRSLTAYSIYFNPAAFFDPTFILIGAGVLAVAILEKKLAENGYTSIASTISSILRIALPGVALLSIIYLISHSSFLL